MEITATEAQNNFGKYLKECRHENIIITKNGKRQAMLIACISDYEDSVCEMFPFYGTSPRKNPDWVTYGKFLEICDSTEGRYELIDGEAYLLAAPSIWHQQILGEMYSIIKNFFSSSESCDVFLSPLDINLVRHANRNEEDILEFYTNVVQPDLSVLCNYRDDIDERGKYKGTPVLVVEILSPSNRKKELLKKLHLYSESGIEEYWIVDPENKIINVHIFAEYDIGPSRTYFGNQTAESVCFPGLKVPLGRLF